MANVKSSLGQVKTVDIEKMVHYKDEFRPLSQIVVNLQSSQSTS